MASPRHQDPRHLVKIISQVQALHQDQVQAPDTDTSHNKPRPDIKLE